jgi:hypothetical protein
MFHTHMFHTCPCVFLLGNTEIINATHRISTIDYSHIDFDSYITWYDFLGVYRTIRTFDAIAIGPRQTTDDS